MNGRELSGEERYQDRILPGVSRTFALTIPTLPDPLSRVVANAYLLCRIADTIEDEPRLSAEQKHEFSERFIAVLGDQASADDFAGDLLPLLGEATLDTERDLIRNVSKVVRLTHSFSGSQRHALTRCVRIMSRGMAEFQHSESLTGLRDLSQLDRYCYHVAGVVGEMLTELFCEHVEAVRGNREMLLRLAVSFGQGLQMTNILKDVWEDRERGACWLPQDVFRESGFDLAVLTPGSYEPAFGEGLSRLIGITQGHLRNALEYTLHFPPEQVGIRRFCLWALGMAVMTLRKIHRHLDFSAGPQVKISRRSVRLTVMVMNAAASSDATLRFLFEIFTRRLPGGTADEAITSRG